MSEKLKLHLGCGSIVKDGWVNLDLDPVEGVIQWVAPLLPYEDNSVDFIYSEHFIEHLGFSTARILFGEMKRALKIGGVMRMSTPDLFTIIDDYDSGSWLDKYIGVGFQPKTGAQFVNEAMRSWDHKFIYDAEEMFLVADMFCFSSKYVVDYKKSHFKELDNLETRPDYDDLIMEFIK